MNKLIKLLAVFLATCFVAGCGEEDSNSGPATIGIPPTLTVQGGGAAKIPVSPRDRGIPLPGFSDSSGR
jgi:hypothetical protein